MSKDSKNNKNNRRINCFDCEYHVITWQPQTPYACKAIGFKSKLIPSLEVFKNSGEHCKFFKLKKNKTKS